MNIQDVKDILQTLQISKACGDDGILATKCWRQLLKLYDYPWVFCLGILYEPVKEFGECLSHLEYSYLYLII
jgi:hypothetical protein